MFINCASRAFSVCRYPCIKAPYSLHLLPSFSRSANHPSSLLRSWLVGNCVMAEKMNSALSVKVPNIVVYTGEDPSAGKCSWYENIVGNLELCLNSQCYTIYLLTPREALQDPWQENVILLIVSSVMAYLSEEIAKKFETFATMGGVVVNFGSNLPLPAFEVSCHRNQVQKIVDVDRDGKAVAVLEGRHSFVCTAPFSAVVAYTNKKKPAVLKVKNVVLSEVHLDVDPVTACVNDYFFLKLTGTNADRLHFLRDILSTHLFLNCDVDELPTLTPCFLFLKNDNQRLTEELLAKKKLGSAELQLLFEDCLNMQQPSKANWYQLPVQVNAPSTVCKPVFDIDIFFANLKTQTFGHTVFFVDVIGTTMDIVENLGELEGPVVISCVQICGKGRGRNLWLTPRGAAAFSMHFSFSLSSKLGQRLSVIQQLVTLAAVHAIRKMPGYETLDIRMKWPNDIYYGKENKVGGVLVTSSVQGDIVHVFAGCGVNISNSKPTLCLNDAIEFYNKNTGSNLSMLSREQFIACCLNELEKLIEDFQATGPSNFLALMNSYWLHSGQTVTLEKYKQEVTIIGVDEFGFLMVEDENGIKISLQPDGNSFDMFKNMIRIKQH